MERPLHRPGRGGRRWRCCPACPPRARSERARGVTLAGLGVLSRRRSARWSSGSRGTSRARSRAGRRGARRLRGVRWLRGRGLARPRRAARRRSPALAVVAARRARRRLVGAEPLPRAPLREPQPAAEARRRGALGARRARREDRDRRASAASSTSTRSTAPTSRTRSSGWATEGPDGAYLRIPTCAEWRQALADGGYTHVVTTYDPFHPGALTDTKEALWTREDPARQARSSRDGPVSVFELDGAPDPAALRRPARPEPGRARRRLGQRRARPPTSPDGRSNRCSRSTPCARSSILARLAAASAGRSCALLGWPRPAWLSGRDRLRRAGRRRAVPAPPAGPGDDRRGRARPRLRCSPRRASSLRAPPAGPAPWLAGGSRRGRRDRRSPLGRPAVPVQRAGRGARRGHLHQRPRRAALLGRLAPARLRPRAERGPLRLSDRPAGGRRDRRRGHRAPRWSAPSTASCSRSRR